MFFLRTYIPESMWGSNILKPSEYHYTYTHLTIANIVNYGFGNFYLVPCTTFELKHRVPPGSIHSVRDLRELEYISIL